ncbi:acyl-CoA thioesterase [Mycobacterium kansasii]
MASTSKVPSVPSVPSVPETPAPQNLTSGDFPVLWPVLTRWADNDMFGHLNNAVYYQLFDTAINAWINTGTNLDPLTTPSLGIVAESGCRYFSELHFPQQLVVGLAVTRLGRSSVTYRLGVFTADSDRAQPITALGHWVHVYVDRTTRKPVPIPEAIRSLLATACVRPARTRREDGVRPA